jgi:riboflavin kinase / FMN adenylyltransferase
MRVHRRFDAGADLVRGSSVAVGNFDGVHQGHRAVLSAARAMAGQAGAPFGVVTFEPHPREVLSPASAPPRLTPFRRKAELLRELGVELCVVLPFEPKLMRLPPEIFVRELLVGRLGISAVAAGEGFRFGYKRAGDMALMAALGRELGFVTEPVPALRIAGEICSSTRVRELLASGRLLEANTLLASPLTIEGVVRAGDRRGRELGFPTANVWPLSRKALLPAHGIYAVRAGLQDGPGTHWHEAVASLGVNPTFDGATERLEVHLLDGEHALYGRRLKVVFLERLRDEKRYGTAEELIAQIRRDCEAARRIHADLAA